MNLAHITAWAGIDSNLAWSTECMPYAVPGIWSGTAKSQDRKRYFSKLDLYTIKKLLQYQFKTSLSAVMLTENSVFQKKLHIKHLSLNERRFWLFKSWTLLDENIEPN